MACNELATSEQLPSGAYAAKAGHHDDILMTRAIAMLVADEQPPEVKVDLPPLYFSAW